MIVGVCALYNIYHKAISNKAITNSLDLSNNILIAKSDL